MKKHIFTTLAAAVMCAGLSSEANAQITTADNNAYFYVDGLRYYLTVTGGTSAKDPAVATAGVVYDLSNSGHNYRNISGEINIPSSVTYKDVEVPVTIIYASAFANNSTITKVTVPASVTTLNASVFKNATALREVILSGSNVTTLYANLFQGCTELLRVDFPASVTRWYTTQAFEGCAKLKSVTFPENSQLVTVSDGSYSVSGNKVTCTGAFNGCVALKSFTFPALVKTVSASGMFYNSGVTAVTFADNRDVETIDPAKSSTWLRVSGTYLFAGAQELRTVSFPKYIDYLGTTSVDNYMFYNCQALKNVLFPDDCVINTVGNRFMAYCPIASVKLPDTVKTIGTYAFYNCTGLKHFTVPASVTVVPEGCFNKCTSLEGVDFPEGLTSMGAYVFSYDSALKSMVIPEGVTQMGTYPFSYCENFETLVLPSTLTKAGYLFNADCVAVKTIVARAAVPSTVSIINTQDWAKAVKIYVPSEDAKTAYLKKNGWQNVSAGQYLVVGTLTMPAEATMYLNEVSALVTETTNKIDSSVPELPIVWKSSNPEIASVDAQGRITAHAVTGDTPVTITGSYWGLEQTCEITVKENPFIITPKEMTMNLGNVLAPDITLALNGNTAGETLPANPVYTLVSADPAVVEITEAGQLKGLQYGVTTVTATYRGESKEFTVYVQPVGEFTLPDALEVQMGKTLAVTPWLDVDGTAEAIDPSYVSWTVDEADADKLFVDAEGNIYGLKTGKKLVLRGNYYGKSTWCSVNVVENTDPDAPQARDHELTIHMPQALGQVTVLNATRSTVVEFDAHEGSALSTAQHNDRDITGDLNNNRYTVSKAPEAPSVITATFNGK